VVQALCECWLVSGGPGLGELAGRELAVGTVGSVHVVVGPEAVELGVEARRRCLIAAALASQRLSVDVEGGAARGTSRHRCARQDALAVAAMTMAP
jgi:hypothetical protein